MLSNGSELPDFGRLADPARLDAVRRSGLLTTTEGFDRYTRLARAAIQAPMVLFSVVGEQSQHYPSQIGLTGPLATQRSTPLGYSYCPFVVDSGADFVVADCSRDPRVSDRPAHEDLGVAAYAGMPVRDRDGMVLGAFCVIDHEPRAWTDEELTTLRDLAASLEGELALRSTGEAYWLEREQEALRFEQERARTLEQVVIPTALPTAAGLAMTGAYLAPSTRQRVGGDLYDAVVRHDDAVGVVIADAVGHDLEATRAAARVRHAVGMLTVEEVAPGRLLQSVNSYLLQSSRSRLVTCAYLLIEPADGMLTVANAGHPQPRLIRGGQVTPIGPAGDPLLGVAPQTYRQESLTLEQGDVIVGFTDGLIERRSRSILDGESWLDGQLALLAGESPEAISKALLTQVGEAEREDDIALIVFGYDGVGVPGAAVVDLVWPAEEVSLADARAGIRQWLAGHGREGLDQVACLVATELLTNARSASPAGAPVRLQARFDRGDALLTVENEGSMFVPDRVMPGPSSERGRGLALVRQLARQLQLRVTDERVVVVEARLGDFEPGS